MTYVTLGGVTIGLIILGWQLTIWWPGTKRIMKDPVRSIGALLPFVLGWCYGALTILGVGGVIGWVSGTLLSISSWLGDVALVWGVGGTSGEEVGREYIPLTETGLALLLVLTAVTIAASKKSKHGASIGRGAWCGICLGTSAGIAGFAAAPLANAANSVGNIVFGYIL